ncbi:HesB/IscA family protein [Ichthyobacterium seriolicida]|uniref:Iron-sulfur binding protein n=1 Tax=Ichthyobacterium seriolicida TaxID=242600 RepID=A0A1J1E5K9_9FLAO|nr:iron-sulfur cluster assembly accessory protein [Ichthyobacterium seriolicida]BAV94598.1 iron-sulfur binding protein [Ichthyobacterium seriolicida]
MVSISDSAKKQIRKLMEEDNMDLQKSFVRIKVNSGGCSGLHYDLSFDTIKGDNDESFESDDIKLLVDKKSYIYLVGTVLDYSGGISGKGFQFVNPNATRTCGCGESFSL